MAVHYATIPSLSEKDIKRLWSKIEIKGKDDCWIFTGRNVRGYGQLKITRSKQSKMFFASRLVFFVTRNKDPKDKFVLHRCDNPPCCNPTHLFLGTHQDNMDDMVRKGRAAKGDNNGSRLHPESRPRGDNHWAKKNREIAAERVKKNVKGKQPFGENHKLSKLTSEQVIEIRNSSLKPPFFAKKHGVSLHLIYHIRKGMIWKHLL